MERTELGGKAMITRAQFQSKTGLTRKALRIYEEKGLLKPEVFSNQHAAFSESALKSALLIKSLRRAGVPIKRIESLLLPKNHQDGNELQRLQDTLNEFSRDTFEALALLEEFSRRSDQKVQKQRHGGYWAYGKEADLRKSEVAEFVTEFAASANDLGQDISKLAARYNHETHDNVHVTCFIESDAAVPKLQNNYQRFYIPEEIFYAVKAQGVAGQYRCFEGSYARLATARMKETGTQKPDSSIEIYTNYPLTPTAGRTFDALLLN